MNNLSDHLQLEILRSLSYINLFECRKLNSFFRNLIDARIRPKTLIVCHNFYTCEKQWFFDEKKINLDESFLVKDFHLFDSKLVEKIFEQLTKLKIYSPYDRNTIIKSSRLNYFVNLIHLEIRSIGLDGILFLNNLQTLFIKRQRTTNVTNRLLIPNCKKIGSNEHLGYFSFARPESIVWMQIHSFTIAQIKQFINLRYLHCKVIEKENASFIDQLPKLDHLIFYSSVSAKVKLFEDQRNQRRSNLRIDFIDTFFHQIQHDDFNPINANCMLEGLVLDSKSIRYFRSIEIYRSTPAYIGFIEELIYNEWLDQIGVMPNDFHTKFRTIEFISVRLPIRDEMLLLDFISGLYALSCIGFINFNFSKFKQLASICPHLHILYFNDGNPRLKYSLRSRTNYDFKILMHFKNLYKFVFSISNTNLTVDLICELIENWKKLEFGSFKYHDVSIVFKKFDDRFFVLRFSGLRYFFIDKQSLLEHLKENQENIDIY